MKDAIHDLKTVTAALPGILDSENADAAYDMAIKAGQRFGLAAAPEIMMLLNCPGLTYGQKLTMTEFVTGRIDAEARALAPGFFAKAGAVGFSFPNWRYPSQRTGGRSLFEEFGLKALRRPTDKRQSKTPLSQPDCDLYGPAYVLQTDSLRIEYRRAYVCISAKNHGALLIRNNAYYFGRDRLPSAVMLSGYDVDATTLENLNPLSIRKHFQPIALNVSTDMLLRAEGLIEQFQSFDRRFFDWLFHNETGKAKLFNFLSAKVDQGAPDMPHVGLCQTDMPQWTPVTVSRVNECFIQMKNAHPKSVRGLQYRLLSGPAGDRPA